MNNITAQAIDENLKKLEEVAKESMPANWPGTEEQYLEIYHSTMVGFMTEAPRALTHIFGEAVRVAMVKKNELQSAVADLDCSMKLHFGDIDVAKLAGGFTLTETRKHKAPFDYVDELRQSDINFSEGESSTDSGGSDAPDATTPDSQPEAEAQATDGKKTPKRRGRKPKAKKAQDGEIGDGEAPKA